MIIIFTLSCKQKQINYDSEVKNVLTSFQKTISRFPPHCICSNFFSDIPDTTFRKILLELSKKIRIDSINSIDDLIIQYDKNKGKKLAPYLDPSDYYFTNFTNIGSLDFTFYEVHLVINYPIFFNNKKSCLLYVCAVFFKERSSDYQIFIYKKDNQEWIEQNVVNVNIKLPPFGHHDEGSFILKKFVPEKINYIDTLNKK